MMRRTVIRVVASLGIAGALALAAVAPASAAEVTGPGSGGSGGGLVPPPSWPTGGRSCIVRADANDLTSPIIAIVPSGTQAIVQGVTGDNYLVTCLNGGGTVQDFLPE
jgi:hypothetical protein